MFVRVAFWGSTIYFPQELLVWVCVKGKGWELGTLIVMGVVYSTS